MTDLDLSISVDFFDDRAFAFKLVVQSVSGSHFRIFVTVVFLKRADTHISVSMTGTCDQTPRLGTKWKKREEIECGKRH